MPFSFLISLNSFTEILKAFNISVKEFNDIRKEKGITNMHLEKCIRNIDVALYYFDNCGEYFSTKVRDKIIYMLISASASLYPKHDFYRKKLLEVDFSIENVENEISKKNIDFQYRLDNMEDIIDEIRDKITNLVQKEKTFILDYNNEQLYNRLLENIKNGKKYTKDDLTREILYELAIIENKSDALIGDIFNLNKGQVRNIRIKMGFNNKFKTKMIDHPAYKIFNCLSSKTSQKEYRAMPLEQCDREFKYKVKVLSNYKRI